MLDALEARPSDDARQVRRALPPGIDTQRNHLVVLGSNGAIVTDDMGMLRIEVHVQHREDSKARLQFNDVLVDTGAELSWFPGTALESAVFAS